MNLKKIGQWICLLGIVLLSYGLIVYLFNQSRAPRGLDKPTGDVFQDMSRVFNKAGEHLSYLGSEPARARRRDDAGKLMLAGVLVLIVGGALVVSAKKTTCAPPSQ